MSKLQTVQAKGFCRCVGCGDSIRKFERLIVVLDDNGKQVRGEKYCEYCEGLARENNPGIGENEAERNAELERETFGAYLANGCPSRYFDDKQAGYC